MKKPARQKRGQFVIIAVLLMAVMIVSISALMHRAITYYANEPWEEYMTLIGNIELSSRRIVELSLANYTNDLAVNQSILRTNLENWQKDMLEIYLGRGVTVNYSLANGDSYGYSLGLASSWDNRASFSAANATFCVNITSIGLTGYKFTAAAFLNLTIINVTENVINAAVIGEDRIPVDNLKKDNFIVEGFEVAGASLVYDSSYEFVYQIQCSSPPSSPVTLTVWDQRGICARARY